MEGAETTDRRRPELELALLRRGITSCAAERERCGRCHRTPLVGEHVYTFENGRLLCELCRQLERQQPVSERTVHGPELGHSIRVIDDRRAA